MAKLQKKLDLSSNQSILTYKWINLITHTGSVFLLNPIAIKDGILRAANTRGRKMDIPLSQVEEIWIDQKAVVA